MNSIIVWPDISSKLRFQVHYGDGYISYDAYGVDLSAFERRECGIDKPLEMSFGSWFHTQMASQDIQCESKDSFPNRSDCDKLGN